MSEITLQSLSDVAETLRQGFLSRYPEAVVVHFGCGLDTRFERSALETARNPNSRSPHVRLIGWGSRGTLSL